MADLKIPNHVAIIMDGNGRWAKKTPDAEKYGACAGSKNGYVYLLGCL